MRAFPTQSGTALAACVPPAAGPRRARQDLAEFGRRVRGRASVLEAPSPRLRRPEVRCPCTAIQRSRDKGDATKVTRQAAGNRRKKRKKPKNGKRIRSDVAGQRGGPSCSALNS
jgi:hypothetical protein